MSEDKQSLTAMFENLRRLITLNIDYARLTAAEKTTLLLSGIAFYAVLLIIGSMVLLFLSFGIGHMLAETVAPIAAFLYVAAFYVVLFVVIFFLRRKLFIDPITRFVTRLFVKPPQK